MTSKIIILAADRGEREDGSVDYSDYLLVSSDTLKFDEPVFKSGMLSIKDFAADAVEAEEYDPQKDRSGWNAPYVSRSKVVEHIQGLGYTVDEGDVSILWATGYDE
jgi:hypothetical protein